MKTIYYILLLVLSLCFSGCATINRPKSMTYGNILTCQELEDITGLNANRYRNKTYAIVDTSALYYIYSDFWKIMHDYINGWEPKFNCIHITSLYVEAAQLKFASKNFSYTSKAEALAIGEVWYHPDKFNEGMDHAIVIVYTNKGLLFIEPQTGNEIKLSDTEMKSIKYLSW